MILLVLALLFGIPSFFSLKYGMKKYANRSRDRYGYGSNDGEGFIGTGIVGLVIAVCFFLATVISTGAAWSSQISDQENLQRYTQVEQINKQKATRITEQIKGYLADQYPAHERAIFDDLKPANVGWYFARYPQLRASETLSQLSKTVVSLQSAVYDAQLKRAAAEKNIRYRARNPWIIPWVLPQ